MTELIRDNDIPKVMALLEEMHPDAACALDHADAFEMLVATVLSAQTTDVSVNKVTPELFGRYPDPAALAAADIEDVKAIIHSIGFYNNKSANIIKLSRKLIDEYGGEVPDTMEELIKLPGVGRKTANVVMAEAFGKPAIAVDTHVFRVSRRIGLSDGDDPEAVELDLKSVLPEEQWSRAHHLLIFHGRRICHARKPDCKNCRLAAFCKSAS